MKKLLLGLMISASASYIYAESNYILDDQAENPIETTEVRTCDQDDAEQSLTTVVGQCLKDYPEFEELVKDCQNLVDTVQASPLAQETSKMSNIVTITYSAAAMKMLEATKVTELLEMLAQFGVTVSILPQKGAVSLVIPMEIQAPSDVAAEAQSRKVADSMNILKEYLDNLDAAIKSVKHNSELDPFEAQLLFQMLSLSNVLDNLFEIISQFLTHEQIAALLDYQEYTLSLQGGIESLFDCTKVLTTVVDFAKKYQANTYDVVPPVLSMQAAQTKLFSFMKDQGLVEA